jgi:hypothetical protein
MRWGHTAHTRSRYPVVEVQAVAAEHGVSVEGLTVAGGQIRYLLDERRRPAVARELQRHAITETSYRFGATKTGAFILGDRDDDAEDYDDED